MSYPAERIQFPSGNAKGDGHGLLCGNRDCKRGLLLIHEWWGMNDQIQKQAQGIANQGHFLVLVVDMYRGKVAIDFEDAGHLYYGLDWPGAYMDLSGAAHYLKSECGCVAVGVTGFCMGGALSFAAAVHCPEIRAAVPFYGIPPSHVADLTKITIPVQAHFGEKDEVKGLSSPADYEALKDKLDTAGVPVEWHTYDAGHSFTNVSSPTYDKQIADLAIGRMADFMKKHMN